jgi:hypothetical protein
MRFQLADQFTRLLFDLQKRRLRMGCVPGIHVSKDLITELFEGGLVWHTFSACSFLSAFLLSKRSHCSILGVLRMLALVLPTTHKALPILPLFLLFGYLPLQKNDVHPQKRKTVDKSLLFR